MEALTAVGSLCVLASRDDVAMVVARVADVGARAALPADALAAAQRSADALATEVLARAGSGEVLLAPLLTTAGALLDVITVDYGPPRSEGVGDALGGVARARLQAHSFGANGAAFNVAAARVWGAASLPAAPAPVFDVAGVVLAYPGQTRSGDAVYLGPCRRGQRVALIDALGHGDVAADSAAGFVRYLHGTSQLRAAEVITQAHAARAARPRGAVAAVLDVDDAGRGEFVGVGNVEVVAWGAATRPVSRPGTVGVALPSVVTEPVEIPARAGLALTSDGLRVRWNGLPLPALSTLSAPLLLGVIMATAERRKDDASVVVLQRTR